MSKALRRWRFFASPFRLLSRYVILRVRRLLALYRCFYDIFLASAEAKLLSITLWLYTTTYRIACDASSISSASQRLPDKHTINLVLMRYVSLLESDLASRRRRRFARSLTL